MDQMEALVQCCFHPGPVFGNGRAVKRAVLILDLLLVHQTLFLAQAATVASDFAASAPWTARPRPIIAPLQLAFNMR